MRTLNFEIGNAYESTLRACAWRERALSPGHIVLAALDHYARDNQQGIIDPEKCEISWEPGAIKITFRGDAHTTIDRLMGEAEDEYILMFQAVATYERHRRGSPVPRRSTPPTNLAHG